MRLEQTLASGISIFALGLLLFFLERPFGLQLLILPTVSLVIVGWGVVYLTLIRRTSTAVSWRTIVPLVVLSAGLFYWMGEHQIHITSGLGFALDHEMHVQTLGVALLIVATLLTLVLALQGD